MFVVQLYFYKSGSGEIVKQPFMNRTNHWPNVVMVDQLSIKYRVGREKNLVRLRSPRVIPGVTTKKWVLSPPLAAPGINHVYIFRSPWVTGYKQFGRFKSNRLRKYEKLPEQTWPNGCKPPFQQDLHGLPQLYIPPMPETVCRNRDILH